LFLYVPLEHCKAKNMYLAPRERDKLALHQMGRLAQQRLAQGYRLNVPETIALIAAQTMELARSAARTVHGAGGTITVARLMEIGRTMLGFRQVLPGVAVLVDEIQIECLMRDGTKLVTIHHPICRPDGDVELALRGSAYPVPDLGIFDTDGGSAEEGLIPGQVHVLNAGPVILNRGKDCIELTVTNTSDRAIQVGSHYHFIETNPALRFDRMASLGFRLNM
jgi:urease gamma subunit